MVQDPLDGPPTTGTCLIAQEMSFLSVSYKGAVRVLSRYLARPPVRGQIPIFCVVEDHQHVGFRGRPRG